MQSVTIKMTEDVMKVRSKPARPARRHMSRWWMIVFAALLAIASSLLYDAYYGRLGIIGPQPMIVSNDNAKIIRVPPGGNVQAAIEMANSGDVVELQAGAVYNGTISLPNKPLTDFVTIRSTAAADLPADKRVTPSQRGAMATVVAGILGRPAVQAANGANHYRFVGIEFTAASSFYNYGIVVLGKGESAANVPHDIEIDRSYIHPFKGGKARRGIAVNSSNTTIRNSYVEGFAFPGEETQGICGWTGTRNVRIINNYIEGGAENILFGGADPASADLIPQDIEIRGNYLNKPPEWKDAVTVKTLFELKNAKRVQFTGNILTNNWEGSAFRITVRDQDGGAPFSTIEDAVIKDNIIDGAGDGINILGHDDTYPSQTLKRLTISNNLFLNIGAREFKGSGYFIQITEGDDILITNNTVFNTGNIVKFYNNMPAGFGFIDNIVGHGDYGIHGPIDVHSDVARTMFQNNVIMNLNRVSPSDYAFPSGNKIVQSIEEVGFIDPSARDYRLSAKSKFSGKGRGGHNIGADLPPINYAKY